MPTTIETSEIEHGGVPVHLDPAGGLLLDDGQTLVVADLHFEKGSAFARRGVLLPPHDSALTLERLEDLIHRHRPARVVSLGDAFHDAAGPDTLALDLRARLRTLIDGCEWVWVRGNHDPKAPLHLGGRALDAIEVGPLTLRHAPLGLGAEIVGHLHPKARVRAKGAAPRACFVRGCRRGTLVMPALGGFTGGLNVLDEAFRPLFPNGPCAYVLGGVRVHRIPAGHLLPERGAARPRVGA